MCTIWAPALVNEVCFRATDDSHIQATAHHGNQQAGEKLERPVHCGVWAFETWDARENHKQVQIHAGFLLLTSCHWWCRLTMLGDAVAQGIWQVVGVQTEVCAAGLEGLCTEQEPAFGSPLLGDLFEHLAQVRHAPIHLQSSPQACHD